MKYSRLVSFACSYLFFLSGTPQVRGDQATPLKGIVAVRSPLQDISPLRKPVFRSFFLPILGRQPGDSLCVFVQLPPLERMEDCDRAFFFLFRGVKQTGFAEPPFPSSPKAPCWRCPWVLVCSYATPLSALKESCPACLNYPRFLDVSPPCWHGFYSFL